MNILKAFKRKLGDERGSISVEAILMFPMLAWAFMAMFVFFEGLRESNINLKATYTVSDLLSRETDLINDQYLDGMNAVYAWLSRSALPVQMRVTVVRYDEANLNHVNVWSRGINGRSDLTQEQAEELLTPHIPIMADASTAIVVETWALYDPVIDMGLTDTEIYNIVVTAPRFTEQLMLEGIGDGGGSTHDDDTDEDNTI